MIDLNLEMKWKMFRIMQIQEENKMKIIGALEFSRFFIKYLYFYNIEHSISSLAMHILFILMIAVAVRDFWKNFKLVAVLDKDFEQYLRMEMDLLPYFRRFVSNIFNLMFLLIFITFNFYSKLGFLTNCIQNIYLKLI